MRGRGWVLARPVAVPPARPATSAAPAGSPPRVLVGEDGPLRLQGSVLHVAPSSAPQTVEPTYRGLDLSVPSEERPLSAWLTKRWPLATHADLVRPGRLITPALPPDLRG